MNKAVGSSWLLQSNIDEATTPYLKSLGGKKEKESAR